MKKSVKSAERVLILRTCDADLKSYGGFQWPKSGRVEAPDWKPTQVCGNGLHGFLKGEGDRSLASFDPDAVWIAAWVEASLLINLDGKVKFPWAEVAVAGTREEAIQFLRDNGCTGAIVGGTATAGDGGTAIQRTTNDFLQMQHGSLYPALHRLERKEWIVSK
jgi:hypothetical protein